MWPNENIYVSWYDCGGVLRNVAAWNKTEADAVAAKLKSEWGNRWVTVGPMNAAVVTAGH